MKKLMKRTMIVALAIFFLYLSIIPLFPHPKRKWTYPAERVTFWRYIKG